MKASAVAEEFKWMAKAMGGPLGLAVGFVAGVGLVKGDWEGAKLALKVLGPSLVANGVILSLFRNRRTLEY